MRNLYFIRHGDVAMPGGVRRCVGNSDYPLSALGRLRAVLLAPGYEGREVGEVEEAIAREDLTDMTDLVTEFLKGRNE